MDSEVRKNPKKGDSFIRGPDGKQVTKYESQGGLRGVLESQKFDFQGLEIDKSRNEHFIEIENIDYFMGFTVKVGYAIFDTSLKFLDLILVAKGRLKGCLGRLLFHTLRGPNVSRSNEILTFLTFEHFWGEPDRQEYRHVF